MRERERNCLVLIARGASAPTVGIPTSGVARRFRHDREEPQGDFRQGRLDRRDPRVDTPREVPGGRGDDVSALRPGVDAGGDGAILGGPSGREAEIPVIAPRAASGVGRNRERAMLCDPRGDGHVAPGPGIRVEGDLIGGERVADVGPRLALKP